MNFLGTKPSIFFHFFCFDNDFFFLECYQGLNLAMERVLNKQFRKTMSLNEFLLVTTLQFISPFFEMSFYHSNGFYEIEMAFIFAYCGDILSEYQHVVKVTPTCQPG